MENLPEELNSIKPFLVRSEEMKSANPVVSYYCYRYAAQLAMEIRKQNQANQEITSYLGNMLSVMEVKKKEIVDVQDPKEHYEKFITMLFISADNDDRKTGSTKKTAQKFLILSYFIEAFNVFEDLSEDWEEKRIYCKWKTADILKAMKNGQQPLPGGPNERNGSEEVKSNPAVDAGFNQLGLGNVGKPSPAFQTGPVAAPNLGSPPQFYPPGGLGNAPNLGTPPQLYPSGGFSNAPPNGFNPYPPASYPKPADPPPPARQAPPPAQAAHKPQDIPAKPQARPARAMVTPEQRKILEQAKKLGQNSVQEIDYKNIPQAISSLKQAIQLLENY